MRIIHATAGAAALAFLMSVSGGAFAAGDTSGPAAGKDVAPSTSMQKTGNGQEGSAKVGTKMVPADKSGAPGMAGKKGSKSGPTEQPSGK